MKTLCLLSLAAALSFAPALAHETGKPHKHPHDSSTTGAIPAVGPNGGPMVTAEGHPIEMVASEKEIAFFIQDHDGKPEPTKGVTGRAIVTQAGKTTTIALKGAEPNKLVGPLAAPLAAGAKIVFTSKIDGHNLQARFEKK